MKQGRSKYMFIINTLPFVLLPSKHRGSDNTSTRRYTCVPDFQADSLVVTGYTPCHPHQEKEEE